MSIKFGKTGRINNLKSHLQKLSKNEILQAASTFDSLNGQVDSYNESNRYDVIINNRAYPPKTIFGLAASAHLNFDVKSSHFVGGENSVCFKMLESLGFHIKTKAKRPGRREGLVLHQRYSRRDAWKILGSIDTFKPGAGTWGLQGIINDRPFKGDTVLFVTLGTYDGNQYEDAVTRDGALIWKSQARHTPKSAVIRQLITHDASENLVSLFLRTREDADYTYMGPLSLNDWDPLSEKPVHFVWNILNWPLPSTVVKEMGLALLPPLSPAYNPKASATLPRGLVETPPPPPKKSQFTGSKGSKFSVDWAEREARNRQLGLAGEELVIKHEIDELNKRGKDNLAQKVEHVAAVDSAAGFDILSFDPVSGEPKHIEVKTTTGEADTPFFISSNEISVSQDLGDSYWIYRVFNFNPDGPANFYRVSGSVAESFEIEPTAYRATRKS